MKGETGQRNQVLDVSLAISAIIPIAFLLPGGSRTTVVRGQLEAFRQGLKEYGWIEGQNIRIECRFAEGERTLAEIAAELVRLPLARHHQPSAAASQMGRIRARTT